MCYRCQVCLKVVPPRTPQLKHVIQREVPRKGDSVTPPLPGFRQHFNPLPVAKTTRLEIEREVPLCPSCHAALALGIPFTQLCRQHGVAIRVSERARRLATPLPKGRSILTRPNPNGVPQ